MISESFFPLGSWMQTTSAAWDGFARLARSGSGVIALFRNKSQSAEALVRLPQLPEGRYKLRSVITGKDLDIHSNADWSRGIQIDFPNAEAVELLEIEKLS